MNENTIDQLVDAATKLIDKWNDDKNHTVAAAVITKSGLVFTSLNFYHFTGGPDAEVAVLARAASEGEHPVAIVAVGNNGRGILSPCGKCRQTIFDYYPDLQIIMPDNSVKNIKVLLPDTFDWNQQQK
jgi:cytidine deaminase